MNPRPSSLRKTAATRPACLSVGGRAVSTNSRGGAGGAQGEGAAVAAAPSTDPSHHTRNTLSRADALPAKRLRTRGAAIKTEKETEWQSPSLH